MRDRVPEPAFILLQINIRQICSVLRIEQWHVIFHWHDTKQIGCRYGAFQNAGFLPDRRAIDAKNAAKVRGICGRALHPAGNCLLCRQNRAISAVSLKRYAAFVYPLFLIYARFYANRIAGRCCRHCRRDCGEIITTSTVDHICECRSEVSCSRSAALVLRGVIRVGRRWSRRDCRECRAVVTLGRKVIPGKVLHDPGWPAPRHLRRVWQVACQASGHVITRYKNLPSAAARV